MEVMIVGTRGVPAEHGGFETFAEDLSLFLVSRGHRVVVYCQTHRTDARTEDTWNGVHRVIIPSGSHALGTIYYDWITTKDCSQQRGVVLTLGYNTAVFSLMYRMHRLPNVMNMDGIEWKRDKWIRPAKWYLWWAEKTAVKYSHADISDNESIQDYTAYRYKTLSNIIEYGADHTIKVTASTADTDTYPFLSAPYAFKVCRIEPENNIHIVLEAFSRMKGLPLVMIGNWNNSEYGKSLRREYGETDGIMLMDPIYDQAKLDLIRGNAALYIHGHSAGGTNPSLVEAMYLGLPVIAFHVSYNKTTTEHKAWYFSSVEELMQLVTGASPADLRLKAAQMKEIADRRYTWAVIARKYTFLVHQVLETERKVTVKPDASNLTTKELLGLGMGHLIDPSYFYEKR